MQAWFYKYWEEVYSSYLYFYKISIYNTDCFPYLHFSDICKDEKEQELGPTS